MKNTAIQIGRKNQMSKPSIEQYQGQPTLCLNPEARYKFSFGVAKAKMILEHLAEIQAFVASEGTSVAPSTSDSTFYSGGAYPVRGESSADKLERERTTKRNSLSFDAAPTDGVNLDALRRDVF
jgi:hypothetical protein